MRRQEFDLTVDSTHVLLRFGPNILNHRYLWDSPRHNNVDYELHVILHGSCTLEVAEDTLHLSAGDALIIAPGIYHTARADDGPFERFTLTFASDGSSLTQLRSIIHSYARIGVPPEIRGLCAIVMREYGNQAPYRDDLLHFQLGQLLVYLLRQLALLEERTTETGSGADKVPWDHTAYIIPTIESFFVNNMAHYGTMQRLADQLHISKRQLCRLIPELYGMTFREKLLDTRMDYAAYLLRTTQKSTPEICKQVGYSSEPTFYTKFKQHHGISPAQYRRKYQNPSISNPQSPTPQLL